jgi:cyclic-di-GMP-binding protein
LMADNKGQLDTVVQMLKEKMARRGVAVNALKRGKMEEASHDTVRESCSLHIGIESDDARAIVKQIKQLGVKVQAQIMENKVRVTGKKIDELQTVIAHLKEHGPEYPLQFVNLT